MQISPLTYYAWLNLLEFIDDDAVVLSALPDLRDNESASAQLDALEYGSDWLHLWLLSGRATTATSGSYEAYTAVVTTMAFRLEEASLSRRQIISMWPPLEPEQQVQLNDPGLRAQFWPTVPASSTKGMFDLCASKPIMTNQRSTLAWSFLASPAASRYRCI